MIYPAPGGFMAERPPVDPVQVRFWRLVMMGVRLCEFSGCEHIAGRLVHGGRASWWLCNSHDWQVR